MTTISDLIDYLGQFPPTARVYLDSGQATAANEMSSEDGTDYITLDALWYAAEASAAEDQLSLFEEGK